MLLKVALELPINLNDLDTFVAVVEAGTFTQAAQQLGVPKSTVSRRVARLEAHLGTGLLTRSSRSFEISDDGLALYARCAPALRDIRDVERDLADSASSPRGRVRVTTSIDVGTSQYLAELLASYSERYRDVRVHLQITNRVVDLLEENIDLGFRSHIGALPSRDDLVTRTIGPVTLGVFASPSYVARHGEPASLDALGEHRTLSHNRAYLAEWPAPPDLTADDYRPLASMMAAGAGIGVLPDFVAASYVAEGRLVRVLSDWTVPPATLSLVWLRSRHLAPRVRAFIDLAVARARLGGLW